MTKRICDVSLGALLGVAIMTAAAVIDAIRVRWSFGGGQ